MREGLSHRAATKVQRQLLTAQSTTTTISCYENVSIKNCFEKIENNENLIIFNCRCGDVYMVIVVVVVVVLFFYNLLLLL